MDNQNFIYGRNPIFELLMSKTASEGKNASKIRNINKIIISKGLPKDAKIEEIISLAKANGILFQFAPKEKFAKFKDVNHQGVIAYVSPVEYEDLEDFLNKPAKNKYKRIVILDGVEDPHNLGAVIRTAVCAGFDAVILPQRHSSLCSATVEKTSAGAINYIDIIKVNSLSNTLDRLKDFDFWVIAAEARGKDNYFEVDYTNMNFAVIFGAENAGISKTLLNKSDFFVKIPMLNNFNSLNVSNAASVIIYESTKQIIQKMNNTL